MAISVDRRDSPPAQEQLMRPQFGIRNFAANYPISLLEANFPIDPKAYEIGAHLVLDSTPSIVLLSRTALMDATTKLLQSRSGPLQSSDVFQPAPDEISTIIAPHLLQRKPNINDTTAALTERQIDRYRILMDRFADQARRTYDKLMDQISPDDMDEIKTLEDLSRIFGKLDMQDLSRMAR